MDYTCKKLIDLFVLNFKAMSLTQVKVRGKKDFCIFFAGKQLMCCDRAPLSNSSSSSISSLYSSLLQSLEQRKYDVPLLAGS